MTWYSLTYADQGDITVELFGTLLAANRRCDQILAQGIFAVVQTHDTSAVA